MSKKKNWTTESEAETRALARDNKNYWNSFTAIALVGPLGAGKTTFVKGLVEGLGGCPREVRSPTFTLVNQYSCPEVKVAHADLYRLDSRESQLTVGLEDYFGDSLVVVEWADRWELGWPEKTLTVTFSHDGRSSRMLAAEENQPDALSN